MAKVFVVEDSPDLLEFFGIFLKMRGYDSQLELTADDLLDKISAFKPDVILLDILLGGQDARNICREIKQEACFENVAIILMSAAPDFLNDFESYGALDVLEKPFDIGILAKKIAAAVVSDKSILNIKKGHSQKCL